MENDRFWVKASRLPPDLGQLRHVLSSGAPFPFVLPRDRWILIDRDRVLAMYGFCSKSEDAGGSDQAYQKYKDLKRRRPDAFEELLTRVDAVVAKARAHVEAQVKRQPLKWAISDKEPAEKWVPEDVNAQATKAESEPEPEKPSILDKLTRKAKQAAKEA